MVAVNSTSRSLKKVEYAQIHTRKAIQMHPLHGSSWSVVHSVPGKSSFILVLAAAMAIGGVASGTHLGVSDTSTATSLSATHLSGARDLGPNLLPANGGERALGNLTHSVSERKPISSTWGAFPPREASASYASGYAPMGIADLGQASGGSAFYTSSSFAGSAQIESLSVCGTTTPCGSTELSFQLNLNVGFEDGGNWYDYWVQDVALVDTGSQSIIAVENNIWNLSASGASMYNSTVSGYGSVSSYDGVGYYGDGVYVPVSYSAFQLIANTSLNSNRQPVVSFMFDVGGGFSAYDVVTFSFATQLDYSDDFIVDGYTSNPAGLAYDAEWIMGGPGGGASTIDESSNLQLGLQYWNGNNYESINNATDYGEDTGESIGTAYVTGEFYDSDGALFAQVSSGSENPGVLWYATYIAIVDVQGPGSSNATVIPGAGGVPYIGGIAAIAIGATSLDFQVACNGFTDDLGTHSLAPGSTTILTVGPWAWVNFTESGLPSA